MFRFTWARTCWALSSAWALEVAEKRRNSASPIRAMPTTATAVKDKDKIYWMLERWYSACHR